MRKENKNIKQNYKTGFVLVFAIFITAILFSIALGVASITQKLAVFSVSAKKSNEAFFAADTGAECALFYDLGGSGSSFGADAGDVYNPTITQCAGNAIDITGSSPWEFYLYGLGSSGEGCAQVTVEKDNYNTTITSKGYMPGGRYLNCDPNNSNRVERELQLTYGNPGVGIGPGYPEVVGFSSGHGNCTGNGGNDDVHLISMPAGIQENDLVLVLFNSDAGSSDNFTFHSNPYPGSWSPAPTTPLPTCMTEITPTPDIDWHLMESSFVSAPFSFGYRYYVAWFIASPTEVGLPYAGVYSSAAQISAHQVFVIKKYGGTVLNPAIAISNSVNGHSANPDSPSFAPAFSGNQKSLWISSIFRDFGATITVENIPTDYIGGQTVHGFCNNNGASVDTARRYRESGSEDPGLYSLITTTFPPWCLTPPSNADDYWTAFTIAIQGE